MYKASLLALALCLSCSLVFAQAIRGHAASKSARGDTRVQACTNAFEQARSEAVAKVRAEWPKAPEEALVVSQITLDARGRMFGQSFDTCQAAVSVAWPHPGVMTQAVALMVPSKQADTQVMACHAALDDGQLQASQGAGLPAALFRTMQSNVSLPYATQCVCNSEARGMCLGVTEYTHVRKGAKPSYLRFALHETAKASGSKPARIEVADKLLVRVQEAAASVVSAMGKGYRHTSISNEVSGNHLAGIGQNHPFFCDTNHKSGCVVRRMVEVMND